MLTVDGLAHSYDGHPALSSVSFSVAPGEIYGLLGPNGGGKTTLFRILSTLLELQEGQAEIAGHDVASAPREVRRKIGVVFQSPSLDGKLTARENMRHQGHLYGLSGAALEQRIDEMLTQVAMADRADQIAETLSGGQARRIDLAKGLMHRPELVLLDEPTTGLDPGARLDLWQYLEQARRDDGLTVLVTTHLMEDADRCDRLAIVDAGRIAAEGSPDELRARVGGDVVSIRTPEPDRVVQELGKRLDEPPEVVDRLVRIRRQGGYQLVPELYAELGPLIEEITVGRPTLEDVFIQVTGHRLSNERPDEAATGS